MTAMPLRFSSLVRVPIPENNHELGDEITRLAGHINAAQYRFLKLLAALIERGAWSDGNGIKSPAHWLNYYCGISLGPAREKIRVAQCLASLPLIDAAFSRGEISYSKVRALTRSATAENEHYLLEIARFGTASHVEKLVRKHQAVKRMESDDQDKTPEFACYYDDDGMLVFRGRLRPEDGALFMQAMQTMMDARQSNAFQQKTEAGGEAENVSAETSLPETQMGGTEKRADALVQMAEQVLTGDGERQTTLNGADKYQVMVHVRADMADGHADCHLQDGPLLSASTLQRLACDAGLLTVLEDNDGHVLNVGRKTRTVPPALRRALKLRDGGCRFPGCCESRHVDAHHIHHWAQGGETRLDNLVLLCRSHHRLVHEAGFQVVNDKNQGLVFFDPNGNAMPSAHYPQFETKNVSAETFFELERQNEDLGLEIDPDTAVTAWQGEAMDYDLGVEALFKMI